MNTTIKNIKQWTIERNLHKADPRAQMRKLMEESGELAAAINKDRWLCPDCVNKRNNPMEDR